MLHEEALIKGSQILNVVLIANHLSDIRLRLGEEGVWSLQFIFYMHLMDLILFPVIVLQFFYIVELGPGF